MTSPVPSAEHAMSPSAPIPPAVLSPFARPWREAGLTLLELMLALGLSSIVISAGLSIAVATQQASSSQGNRAFVQELGRGAVSAIANDLTRAGLGWYDTTDPAEMQKLPAGNQQALEWAVTFKQHCVNNNADPDVLQFVSGQSPDGYSGVTTFTSDTDPVQVAPEVAVTVTVSTIGAEGFHVIMPDGAPANASERISLFSRDRAFLGTGDYVPDDNNPNPTNGQFNFTYHPPDPAIASWETVTALEPATIIIRGPWVVTWRMGSMVDEQGNTVGCLESVTCGESHPNGDQGGNDCVVGDCIGPIEDFQVGYLMADTATVDVDFDPAGVGKVDERLRIRAVQVWVLARSPGPDLLVPDTKTYQLGNRSFTPDPQFAKYQRQVFTRLVALPNIKD